MTDRSKDIIKYLDGEMTPDKEAAFEQELRENDALREEFDEWKFIKGALENELLTEAESAVRSFEEAGKKKTGKYVWMAAAAVVLLLVVSLFLLQPANTVSYDDVFTPYPDITRVRGGSAPTEQAMSAYSNGNFEEAAALFERISPRSDTLNFYRAVSMLYAGQASEADSVFQALTSARSIFSQEAEWMRVKALLDSRKSGEARDLLEHIRQTDGHGHQQDADDLLERL